MQEIGFMHRVQLKRARLTLPIILLKFFHLITDIPPQRPIRLNDHRLHQKLPNCTLYNSTKTRPFAFKLKYVIDLKVSSNIMHLYPCIGLRRLSPSRGAGWKPRDFVHPSGFCDSSLQHSGYGTVLCSTLDMR
jgi:hypothetical protein